VINQIQKTKELNKMIPEILEVAKYNEDQDFRFVDNSDKEILIFNDFPETFEYAYIPSRYEMEAELEALAELERAEENAFHTRFEEYNPYRY
jgi:hypothetical protein